MRSATEPNDSLGRPLWFLSTPLGGQKLEWNERWFLTVSRTVGAGQTGSGEVRSGQTGSVDVRSDRKIKAGHDKEEPNRADMYEKRNTGLIQAIYVGFQNGNP